MKLKYMLELISIFSAAALGGVLASILRQPVILGYLLAGITIGPFGLGLIQEYEQVEVVAELGVTFLLFALGVEFSFEELKKVKVISLGGGGLQISLTILTTVILSTSLGWVNSIPEGVLLGQMLSLSSTAVVIKVLMDNNEKDTPQGQVMLGILIIQDLALGLMLAVLPALNKPAEEIGIAMIIALVKLILFALGAIIVGKWLVPPILRLLAKTESKELFLLGVVTICLGVALFTGKLGLSTEMGAFVAGLMISEIEYADETLSDVEPLRDICSIAFFASIGVLINPIFLWDNLPIILGLVALVVLGKALLITPIVLLFRYPLKTALVSGLGLAQIGEFSFVLAGEGNQLGILPESVYLMILGTTAVTLIITPFVFKAVPLFFKYVESIPQLKTFFAQFDQPVEIAENLPSKDHIIICGYGQIGSNIISLLKERNYPILVIEQSEQKVKQLRKAEIPYIYGNASSNIVLEKAKVNEAKGMAVALPDALSTRLCIRRSLTLNPELDLVVCAYEEKDIELFYQIGAKEVVQPEFEASIELSTHLFNGLGFPLEAVQQNMQKIRSSHYQKLRSDQDSNLIFRQLEEATRTMSSQWYPLPVDSPLVGKTLEKSYIRRLTGVTLMAIIRFSGEKLDYPEPDTEIKSQDKLLIVGDKEDLAAFDRLAKGEIKNLPQEDDSCVWIKIIENGHLVGKSLKQVEELSKSEVFIQSIRREGKYIRFPDRDTIIEIGDRVLMFGKIASLTQLSQKLTIPVGNRE